MNDQKMRIGSQLPAFRTLRGVDGKPCSNTDFNGHVVVVVFSCNHCPYVQAYEDRMKALQRDYASKNVQLVAINSNDERNYPDDSFAKMVERAKQRELNFPYLRDEDQSVAESFGATHTPQFFVFDKDRKLRYSGKMDDNWQEPQRVKQTYLRDAIDAILGGREVPISETFSVGCTIKWK